MHTDIDSDRSSSLLSRISFGILGVGALALAAALPRFPARWATHFDHAGNPNQWTDRSWMHAAFPLFLGLFVIGLTQGIQAVVKKTGNPERLPLVFAATFRFVSLLQCALACAFVVMAFALPLGASQLWIILTPLVLVVAAVILGGAWVQRAMEKERAGGNAQLLEGYHGLYYAKKDDPRLWVPKLAGMGWTINFAHRWAWPMMIALLSPAIVGVGVALLAAAR